MKALLAGLMLVGVLGSAACGPRQVEVGTGVQQSAEVAIHMTNNLSQAVNVYVNNGGSDIFVKQVSASSTEHLPVSGVSSGSNVTLLARTVDGTRTYRKDNVVLTGTVSWQVP